MNQNHQPTSKSRYDQVRQKYYPFFWFLAAADEGILRGCPSNDKDKQAGIGLTILCTSVAAVISSYYALFSLFNTWYTALPIALFWGIIIFNIDRLMVGSIRKDRDKNWLNEVKVALPRIVLALFIAILISKPLEVKIFKHQIDAEQPVFNNNIVNGAFIVNDQKSRQSKTDLEKERQVIATLEEESRNPNLDANYRLAKDAYTDCLGEKADLEKKLSNRRQYRLTLINSGRQDRTTQVNRDIANLKRSIQSLNCPGKKELMSGAEREYIDKKNEEIRKAKEIYDKHLRDATVKESIDSGVKATTHTKAGQASKDILGQLRILNSLKAKDPSMLWASWLITTLFFVLELSPLLLKILSPRGEYDTHISAAEVRAFHNEEANAEESEQDKRIRIRMAGDASNDAQALNEKIKENVQEKLLEVQTELAKEIAEAWHQQQKAQLAENREQYLKDKIVENIN